MAGFSNSPGTKDTRGVEAVEIFDDSNADEVELVIWSLLMAIDIHVSDNDMKQTRSKYE